MEGWNFVTDRMNRATLAALALLLDDCAKRIEGAQAGKEPGLDDIMRLAEAKRLSEELRHLLSLPPSVTIQDTSQALPAITGEIRDSSGTSNIHGSRITSRIASGEIKRSAIPDQGEEEEILNLNMGLGKIEISENDEVTDVIEKSPAKVLEGNFPKKRDLPTA